MNQMNVQRTLEAETLEERMFSKGMFLGAVSYNPKDDFIYLGDAREFIDKSNRLINVDLFNKSKVLGASGKVDEANKIKGIYTNKYLQMIANKLKIAKIQEKTHEPLEAIGNQIRGAAGPTATTDYENIRRTGDLLEGILGQEHTNEDYQAINIAEKVNKESLRFEYIKRTTARMIAQRNIADDQEALPLKHAYTSGTKDIFAYGMQFISSMRDNIDTKADIVADFIKQVPDAILAAKNEDVLTLLNAITGNNQGDWDAFTSGIADVSAAAQIQTAEASAKAYGSPLVAVFDTTAFNGYMKNLQGAYFQGQAQNIANQSRSQASAKSGQLLGNPAVTYYIDDGLTAATYVLAAKSGYMKYFQAMVVQTSFKNVKTPGQAEQRFWYDFAGFEEVNSSAQYKGTSVLS